MTVHEVSWQLAGSRDGLCCRGSRLGLSQLSEHLLAGPSKLSPHHTGTRPTCKFRVTEKEDLFLFSFCLFVDPCFGVPHSPSDEENKAGLVGSGEIKFFLLIKELMRTLRWEWIGMKGVWRILRWEWRGKVFVKKILLFGG